MIVGVYLAGFVLPLAVEGVGIGFVRSLGGSSTGIGRRAVVPAGDGLQHGVAVLEDHGVCRLERVPAVSALQQLLPRRVGNGCTFLKYYLVCIVLATVEVYIDRRSKTTTGDVHQKSILSRYRYGVRIEFFNRRGVITVI